MKTVLFLTGFIININVYAFTQTAKLDFTNLYGNTDAGVYNMAVSFVPKTTPSVSFLNFSTHHDDGINYCVTEAKFEIGTMKFVLTDKQMWQFEKYKTVFAVITQQSEDATCVTELSQFSGRQTLYAQIGLDQAILLPVKAPYDFKTVTVWLAPFNGYLTLATDIAAVNGELIVDPSKLLTEDNIVSQNKNNASVTYYVTANKQNTSLSLGSGLVKF